jgi:hypothetical protein
MKLTWDKHTIENVTQHRSNDGRWIINQTTDPRIWMLFDTETIALHAQGSVGYLKHCAAYDPPEES